MSRTLSAAVGVGLAASILLSACTSSSGGHATAKSPATAETSAAAKPTSPGATPATAEPTSPGATPAAATPPLGSFDAPRKFTGRPARITLNALDANAAGDFSSRFTLAGDRAYGVTPTSVGAVDLASGKTLWETRFPNAPRDDSSGPFYNPDGPGAPVLSADGSTVYAVMIVEIQGSGTTATSYAAQVIAVDTRSGHLAWKVNIPAGPYVTDTAGSVEIAAADDRRVIVSRQPDSGVDGGTVAAVDSTTHKVLWSKPGVVHAVTPRAVVAVVPAAADQGGPADGHLAGLDPGTGRELWRMDGGVNSSVLESDSSMVVTITSNTAEPRTVVIDPASGRVTKRFPNLVLYGAAKDGNAVYDADSTGIRALDPTSLAMRWKLPQGNRIAPRDPVFFGGLVYGQVLDGMSVILDGRTGADVTRNVPGAFVAVNQHGALMLRDRRLYFVPATG